MNTPELIREQVIRKQWNKVVLERTFRLPNEKIIEYLSWGGELAVPIVFPVTNNSEVVAIRQFRYGINEVVLELPGGCSEHGMSLEETGRKELLEETGFTAEDFITLGPALWIDPASYFSSYIPILATGCSQSSEPSLEETECIEVVLYPITEWVEKIYSGEVKDSKTIAVTFLALHKLGLTTSI